MRWYLHFVSDGDTLVFCLMIYEDCLVDWKMRWYLRFVPIANKNTLVLCFINGLADCLVD